MQIDDTDKALLALLRENARASTVEIARRLGLSRTTVTARLARLESGRIIVGYTVKLAGEVESRSVRAHITIACHPKASAGVEAALRRLPEVRQLHSVSGPFDMIAVVSAPSVSELDAIIDRIGALEGVDRTTSSILLSTRIDR
ncbi:Lrp/AsnC family transcriptional regulator [Chthonobacter rhizosphaerae]|uniref:Lrp/AsnC family transcriptional regulator n=1 Tax=Chthonobacter rhizosphaerae TaxID=2735553 RepID=UPI0015EE5009|nr:Lrp/AsnC family transcriptional regulator [Chthonobacter rhizosphaerae]